MRVSREARRSCSRTWQRAYSMKNSAAPLALLHHELLPVCIHGVEGEGQAPVGASENHVADRLHSTATHFDQRLFQCRSQTEDLLATASQGDIVTDFLLVLGLDPRHKFQHGL